MHMAPFLGQSGWVQVVSEDFPWSSVFVGVRERLLTPEHDGGHVCTGIRSGCTVPFHDSSTLAQAVPCTYPRPHSQP